MPVLFCFLEWVQFDRLNARESLIIILKLTLSVEDQATLYTVFTRSESFY